MADESKNFAWTPETISNNQQQGDKVKVEGRKTGCEKVKAPNCTTEAGCTAAKWWYGSKISYKLKTQQLYIAKGKTIGKIE